MNKVIITVLAFISCTNLTNGQILQNNIFSNLSGQNLYDKVISTYKTTTTLDYNTARDTLYSKIDAVKDTLECVYTGMKVYLTPGVDPTQAAFNGIGGGINAEHGYPQSKGASTGIGRSDMHHLYPTRVLANSSRMSNPLLDISDNATTSWFLGTTLLTSKPTSNINEYSEATATAFEPREKSKGNLARSIFYFYTMYGDLADAADPAFFGIQKSTLCRWHNDDPVDAGEWKRTFGIAKYQEGKPNPFVLDCSLVSRMYCNNIDQVCEDLVRIASAVAELPSKTRAILYPNPSAGQFWVAAIDKNADVKISLHDIYGRFISDVDLQWGGDTLAYVIPKKSLTSGVYFCRVGQSEIPTQWLKFLVW